MRAYAFTMVAQPLTAAPTAVIEVTAPTLVIVRIALSQQSGTTSAQQAVELLRRTSQSTNVTGPNVNPMLATDTGNNPGPNFGMCTVLGTAGAVLYSDAFNWQNGWIYVPFPEERITQAGSGSNGLDVPHLPAVANTFTIDCTVNAIEIS